jgi:hypothetical protein
LAVSSECSEGQRFGALRRAGQETARERERERERERARKRDFERARDSGQKGSKSQAKSG